MGVLSADLRVTLQILPGFFSNCLFFVLYDSVVLVKRVVSLVSLSCGGGGGAWQQRMLTSAGVRSIWNSFLLDAYKQVKLGEMAPNSKVVKLPVFRRLVENFSDVADFLLVYIDEAHPSDGWAGPPMELFPFEVRKHRNMEDRVVAAQRLVEHFSLPPQCRLAADCMDNNTNMAYGVAYERIWQALKERAGLVLDEWRNKFWKIPDAFECVLPVMGLNMCVCNGATPSRLAELSTSEAAK
ncbi:hypothetical protein HF521_021109 [Silurus meridionalis]|uniref:Iodothyronine deiodinase n=1 Tax=Silurus meridionalis TaxID=175797 RepID=A0A8T0BDS8_SILME|nr:hypothetical protein HF521_021109 [Silurus meridionalis]